MDDDDLPKPDTFAPAGLKYASVSQFDLWILQFSDPDVRDQFFGGDIYTDEEARSNAIEAWNKHAPSWSTRLLRTVTMDEVRGVDADARIALLERALEQTLSRVDEAAKSWHNTQHWYDEDAPDGEGNLWEWVERPAREVLKSGHQDS